MTCILHGENKAIKFMVIFKNNHFYFYKYIVNLRNRERET